MATQNIPNDLPPPQISPQLSLICTSNTTLERNASNNIKRLDTSVLIKISATVVAATNDYDDDDDDDLSLLFLSCQLIDIDLS